jgi:hypothetical protein
LYKKRFAIKILRSLRNFPGKFHCVYSKPDGKKKALAYVKFRQVLNTFCLCSRLPVPLFLEQFCPGWTDFWKISAVCSVSSYFITCCL